MIYKCSFNCTGLPFDYLMPGIGYNTMVYIDKDFKVSIYLKLK